MVIRSFLNQNFFTWNERGFSEKNYLTSGTLYNQPKVRCDLLLILEYLIFAIAALGDDPELEPSWTAISQSNQEWFASEYLPTIQDIYGEEKPVHIRDLTKMSAGERWACLEQWYRIGHLQMLAWKPRTIPDSLSPLPSEECWWHSVTVPFWTPPKPRDITSLGLPSMTHDQTVLTRTQDSPRDPATAEYHSQAMRWQGQGHNDTLARICWHLRHGANIRMPHQQDHVLAASWHDKNSTDTWQDHDEAG
jgi:hypothetical protein